MPAIRTKCITDTIDREYDGLRIAVTRYVPRGVKRTRYHAWMPNLAPSEPLLKAFQQDRIDWKEFSIRYKLELFDPSPMDKENVVIKNNGQKFTLRLIKELARRQKVTLMCTCEIDQEYCHRDVLKDLINSSKV